ncbi:MAG: hypothetical protein JSS75_03845 [Bacteroidetes bacterium]|nr:hypothetical protein [Bacteroidota bacterium]
MARTTSQPLAVGAPHAAVLTAAHEAETKQQNTDEPWAHIDPTVHLPIF